MSADNWTICPACKAAHDKKTAKRMAAAAKSYGEVSAAEYLANLKSAETEEKLAASLREDYENRMGDEGEVYIFYSCSCDCGFGYNFKHEMKVPLTATWKEYEKLAPRR